jgi:hypothetical protein
MLGGSDLRYTRITIAISYKASRVPAGDPPPLAPGGQGNFVSRRRIGGIASRRRTEHRIFLSKSPGRVRIRY